MVAVVSMVAVDLDIFPLSLIVFLSLSQIKQGGAWGESSLTLKQLALERHQALCNGLKVGVGCLNFAAG